MRTLRAFAEAMAPGIGPLPAAEAEVAEKAFVDESSSPTAGRRFSRSA